MTAGTILLAGGGTGGHVFPMVAVADALGRLAPGVRCVFVGTDRGIESRIVPERGYELCLMQVEPIRGGGIRGVARGVGRAVASLPEARALVRRLRPGAVFSVGGYAAGPVSLAARSLGVPVGLMEPNAVIGLSNRLIAPLVQRAYTAFEDAERHFRGSAVLRSGVPIRDGFDPRDLPPRDGPLEILVLGGSQGAKALNEVLPEALRLLRSEVRVVHQCGPAHEVAVRERYRAGEQLDAVQVVSFIDDMPEALAQAQLVVSRSGASAVSEICAVGRPSLLVPYPYAAGDHQRRNAEALHAAGAAICVPAQDATATRLAEQIEELAATAGRLEDMARRARSFGRPHAADTIAQDLLALAGLVPAAAGRGRAFCTVPDPGTSGPVALQETS